ncbi:hypothetical protein RI367_004399 [Sorochytrium milnesiophthora]
MPSARRYAVALYAFTPPQHPPGLASATSELSLDVGQLLRIVDDDTDDDNNNNNDDDADWVLAATADSSATELPRGTSSPSPDSSVADGLEEQQQRHGRQGYVPRAYIEFISEEEYHALKAEASLTASEVSTERGGGSGVLPQQQSVESGAGDGQQQYQHSAVVASTAQLDQGDGTPRQRSAGDMQTGHSRTPSQATTATRSQAASSRVHSRSASVATTANISASVAVNRSTPSLRGESPLPIIVDRKPSVGALSVREDSRRPESAPPTATPKEATTATSDAGHGHRRQESDAKRAVEPPLPAKPVRQASDVGKHESAADKEQMAADAEGSVQDEEEQEEENDDDEDEAEEADARSEMRRSSEFSRKALLAYQRKHARRVTGSIFIRTPSMVGFDGMPPGFRSSAISALLAEGQCLTSKAINPRLAAHGLAYSDLYKDSAIGRYVTRPAPQTMCVSLLRLDNMTAPHSSVAVLSRSLRLALYSKKDRKIVSNVHTIAAYVQKDSDKTWRFSSRSSILNRRDEENTCFLKFALNNAEASATDLTLLLEPVLSLTKVHEQDHIAETADIACGWTTLSLFNAKQQPIDSKTYDIKLQGGTPWEIDSGDVPLGSSGNRGMWRNLLSGEGTPKLVLQVRKVKSKLLSELNNLPTPLITSLNCLPILSLYRLTLLDHVTDQHVFNAHDVPAPLGIVTQLCDDHDWMYLLAEYWRKSWKSMKQSERRDLDLVKDRFVSTLWSFWPMLHVIEDTGIVPSSTDSDARPSRVVDVQLTPAQHFKRDGALITLAKNPGGLAFTPFHIDELLPTVS